MERFRLDVEDAAAFLRSFIKTPPTTGLILGTGLGGVAAAMEGATSLSYEEIPHFPVSTVESHHGRLIFGRWAGKPLLVMQGRVSPLRRIHRQADLVSHPRHARTGDKDSHDLMRRGGLNPQFQAGDLMLITDHINLTGHNPLIGPNITSWGPRFPDMVEPYSRRLQRLAIETALSEKILLHKGVYAGVVGPNLETAAEIRFLRGVGADAVGMSVVMEVITAVHAGMEVLAVAAVTNVNLPDCYQPASVKEIIAAAEKTGPVFMCLLEGVIAGSQPF